MRIAPPRRITQAAVALVIAGTVSAAGITAASATESAASKCANIGTATGAKLKACIASLQSEADTAGHAAQVADEQYLKAKRSAKQADVQYARTMSLATAAQIKAARSRTRAAVVAAHLARTGSTASQTTQVLLSGNGATKVLYNLSRMSELTSDTSQLAADAARDSRVAANLQTATGLAATRADSLAASARAAYVKAKTDSATARGLVLQAQARQSQLSGGSTVSASSASVNINLPANASTAAKVIAFARSQIGDPYVFGGAGPSSWDCSGLTMQAFASVGISIGGHGATVQYDTARSRGLLVSYSAAKPGDLVFYTDGGGDMYHVALYTGGGMMIEAPHEGRDVREVSVRSYQLVGQVARFTG